MNSLSHWPSPPAKRPNSSGITLPDRLEMNAFTESFLFLSGSSSSSLDVFVDRIVDSATSDSDRHDIIERVLRLGSVLLEAGKRSERKRDYFHNSIVWPLPPELTINVFSMLDTQSVCYAAATCTFFRKCALDSLCYASIDLLTAVPKVNNLVVSTNIQRAGKALRSIKLGLLTRRTSRYSCIDNRLRQRKESCILSRSCLNSLTVDGGAPGAMLRRLHLYNIEQIDNTALSAALSACPSLLDLEIAGLHVELRKTLESVSHHCQLIERLYFESSKTGRDDSLKITPTCIDLVRNCPHITSLTLRGFKLQDYKVLALVKGFCKLKYLDLSTSYKITGAFLHELSAGVGGDLLEVVMLCDCMHLKKAEVERFLNAVLAGNFKFLRHLDISNLEGLANEDDWSDRCYSQSFIPMDQLCEVRPNLCLLAKFRSYTNVDSDGDLSTPSQINTASDSSSFMSTSESSYNSDQSSGDERDIFFNL